MGKAERDNNRVTTELVWDDMNLTPEALQVAVASGRVLLDVAAVASTTPSDVHPTMDSNNVPVACVVTDDSSATPTPLLIDSRNDRLFIDLTIE